MNDLHPSQTIPQRLGERFIDSGLLNSAQVEQVLHLQQSEHLRFGEAAIKLGLLSESQVMSILSEQFNYATALTSNSNISPLLAIAHRPFGAEAEAIRQVRAALMVKMAALDKPCLSISVISARNGEGRSYVAASLAIAFSQAGQRTLLIGADLRASGQTDLYGLALQQSNPPQPSDTTSAVLSSQSNAPALSANLAGRSSPEQVLEVPGFPKLSVLPAGPRPPNPQELLAEPRLHKLLDYLAPNYDVMLVDTPAAQVSSDAQVIARQTDLSVLVARKDSTYLKDFKTTVLSLKQADAVIAGIVYFQPPALTRPRTGWLARWLHKNR